MPTVIRVIKYEGTEEALRHALSMSLRLGVKVCTGYAITVAEHSNDLPPILELSDEDVATALEQKQ